MMLSIVIPNYNGSRTLFDTLKCVFDQTPADSEVLVVDDFSTDPSVELIKTNYPTARIIKNSDNLGAACVRNIGIKESTGDFILFVDADVLLEPGCIASLLDAAQTSDITFPRICYSNGQVMYPVDEAQASYLLISPVFLVRRDSLNRMVPSTFDEIYRTYCEDTDFFLRAYLAGLVSCYVPTAKAIHHVDLQPRNREWRYFLETRNSIYGAIKFFGVAGIDHFDHAFHFRNLLKVFLCGLFNFNLFDMQARGYRKYGDVKYNLTILFKKHDPLTERSRLVLIALLVKAMGWNLKNLSRSLTANAHITRQSVQAARKPE
jgi:glycosyltransferase involved in cell wall biosynthesis